MKFFFSGVKNTVWKKRFLRTLLTSNEIATQHLIKISLTIFITLWLVAQSYCEFKHALVLLSLSNYAPQFRRLDSIVHALVLHSSGACAPQFTRLCSTVHALALQSVASCKNDSITFPYVPLNVFFFTVNRTAPNKKQRM